MKAHISPQYGSPPLCDRSFPAVQLNVTYKTHTLGNRPLQNGASCAGLQLVSGYTIFVLETNILPVCIVTSGHIDAR